VQQRKPLFFLLLIIGGFDGGVIVNLDTLKPLQLVFKSTMNLLRVSTKKHFLSFREAIERMRTSATDNKLENTIFHIRNDKTLEDGIINFFNNYDLIHKFIT
jgi:hypothetical protein